MAFPMRVHLIDGANVDPVTEQEGARRRDLAATRRMAAFTPLPAGGRRSSSSSIRSRRPRPALGEGDAAIRAPMNGRLVKLAVEDGETVEAGQRLAVVEAMKMEHALVAPHAGVVRDLEASVGDQVEMGERIMRVERRRRRGRPKAPDKPPGKRQRLRAARARPGLRIQPEREFSAKVKERKRKKKKANLLSFAFFYFWKSSLFKGLRPKKVEKICLPFHSRMSCTPTAP